MANVLIVDDNDLVRELVSEVIETGGHQVMAADCGAAGLQAFASQPFDLVVVDLVMPDMDGVQVIRKFRETKPNLPALLLTGYGDCLNTPDSGMKVDLSHCQVLAKPIDCDDLLAKVQTALNTRPSVQKSSSTSNS